MKESSLNKLVRTLRETAATLTHFATGSAAYLDFFKANTPKFKSTNDDHLRVANQLNGMASDLDVSQSGSPIRNN